MKERFQIDIYTVTSGQAVVYNHFLPQNKHASRRTRLIEDVYKEVSPEPITEGRGYLALDISGAANEDGSDFVLPIIKYRFKKHWRATSKMIGKKEDWVTFIKALFYLDSTVII